METRAISVDATYSRAKWLRRVLAGSCAAVVVLCSDAGAEQVSRSVTVREGSVAAYAPNKSIAVRKGVEIINTALSGREEEGAVYRLDVDSQVEVEMLLPKDFRDVRIRVTLVGFPGTGSAQPVMLVNRERKVLDGPTSGERAKSRVEGVDKDLIAGQNVLTFGSASGRVGLQTVEVFYDAPSAPMVAKKEEPKAEHSAPALKPGDEFADPVKAGGVGPKMVVIPAGAFQMGSYPSEPHRSEDEGPVHVVKIPKAFAVGKFEVTFEEWDVCVLAGACAPADDGGLGRGKQPVINVSWDQALAYTEWLSVQTGKPYRLLSEAEWEYAARAGTMTARHWGNSDSGACQYANVDDRAFGCEDGHVKTAPVGSFVPNAFKLHDMMGNVWEWVADCWNSGYEGAPTDGSAWGVGDCSRHVVRGGSWYSDPAFVRSAKRGGNEPAVQNFNLGFRIARTLP